MSANTNSPETKDNEKRLLDGEDDARRRMEEKIRRAAAAYLGIEQDVLGEQMAAVVSAVQGLASGGEMTGNANIRVIRWTINLGSNGNGSHES